MKRIMMIMGLILLVTTVNAMETASRWDFDAYKIGSLPSVFSMEAGDWKTVSDTAAISKKHVLYQSAKSSSGTFNMILVRDAVYKDVDVSVKMKAVAGRIDQGGGIVWRAVDSKNYYMVPIQPAGR